MKNPKVQALAIVAAVGAIGAGYYFWQNGDKGMGKTPPGPTASATQAPPPPEPDIKYPVTDAGAAVSDSAPAAGAARDVQVLPTLENSDTPFFDELVALLGREAAEAALNSQDFIRHVVVTVENSTGRQLPQQFSPFKPIESSFEVAGEGDSPTMSANNFARYTPYIHILKAVDIEKAVKLYRRYYPLFQAAYHELGMRGYFNDRLVQVIDNLLETPDERSPMKLVLEGAHYKFADSRLEALNGGQKVLLRVGPENSDVIRKFLGQVRRILTHSRGGQ